MQISIFQLLTIGGTLPWKEDDSLKINEEILSPNGIYLQNVPIRYKHAYLCPVDTNKTTLTDFYQWTELSPTDTETFCWRTFYITGVAKDYRGWLPIPSTEMLGEYSYQELFDCIHRSSPGPLSTSVI